jgi:predicted transcriptional regulator YdeE/DNA-binding transcriptional MerR regulator
MFHLNQMGRPYNIKHPMLKIGDFSKLAHVTIKTLRHYDELGLLRPVWIDRYTSYRYYALEQLPRLNRILALKDLGFSLEQIGELLHENLPSDRLRQFFDRKQAELQAQVQAEQARLARVAQRLRQIEQEGCLPAHEVTLKALPAAPTASLRAMIPVLDELPQQTGLMRALVNQFVQQNNLCPAGPWLTLFHSPDYAERNLDVEVALPLDGLPRKRLATGSRHITLGTLPEVEQAASVLLPGGADPTAAYSVLYTWAEQAGYLAGAPLREVLLQDPAPPGSGSAAVTFIETQLPVTSKLIYQKSYQTNPYRKDSEMEPKFVSLPAFTVVGMSYVGKNANQEIAQMWGVFNQVSDQIKHRDPEAALGVCLMPPGLPEGEFEYVASFKVGQVEDVPEGMVVRQVPAQDYAVFAHVGSLEKLRDTYNYIYHVWLPQSGYQRTDGPDIEYYDEDFTDFAPDSRFYIYVPVKK